jgi:signal peptidase II
MTDDTRPAVVGAGLPSGAAAASATPDDRRAEHEHEPSATTTLAARPARRRWALFVALALAVVVADQAAKALVTRALAPGQSVDVVGDLVRVVFGQNSGALFGLFKDNAAMFGIVSIVVIGLIVAYHARSAGSLYLTITLGLLLGGAIGNMVDRLRLGYVVDFVDVGLGPTRFYTFNVADSAISLAILLLFAAALRPSLVDGHAVRPGAPEPVAAAATDDSWGDGLQPDDRPPAGDQPR